MCCYQVVAGLPAGSSLNSSFYGKHIDLHGFYVVSSTNVPDTALLEAALTVAKMVSKRPDLLQTLINEGCT